MTAPARRPWWLRLLRALAVVALALFLALAGRVAYAWRDRNPGLEVAVAIDGAAARAQPRPLRAGFARATINPALGNPARPVYLAGFGQDRRATAQHDDLLAVGWVVDDGHTRVGVVALDAIGLFHDDVVEIRRRLPAGLGLAYSVVCATHNHATPDLMGLWGPHPLRRGVDPAYREQVIATAARVLAAAGAALEPARVAFHEVPTPPDGLVADTRRPFVFDSDLRAMHFTAADDGRTLGTVVTWGNHPETPWSRNTELTADFCGVLREALERGVTEGGETFAPGVGGIACFINGAVGGLMTTHPTTTVRDPVTERLVREPGHEKSRALGRQLAVRLLPRLRRGEPGAAHAPIAVRARTLALPVENAAFLLAPVLGLIDRGHVRWGWMRTEVAVLRLGEASIACVPGEIYPELVNGGIESPPGADFPGTPAEVPPLRELLPGRVKFIFGLANDEIGYIIPRTEWDRRPPYLYGAEKPVYGEVNSLGPATAPRLHAAFRELAAAAPAAAR